MSFEGNKNKLISIITPCFNGSKFIESTYDSVKAQTYSYWEWIIVDDCSSDDSFLLLSKIAEQDNRVKVYKLDKNSGSAAARNFGLEKCSGDYITFLDIDDLLSPEYLFEQKKILDEKGGVVISGYKVVLDNGKSTDYFPPKLVNYKSMLKSDTMSCLTTMMEASLVGDSRFATDLNSVEDYPFMLEVIKKVESANINNKILATYRRNSLSKTKHKTRLIKNFYVVYRRYCKFNPIKSFIYVIRYIIVRLFKYR